MGSDPIPDPTHAPGAIDVSNATVPLARFHEVRRALADLLDEAERASLPMTDDGPPINYQLDAACKRARSALEGVSRGH